MIHPCIRFIYLHVLVNFHQNVDITQRNDKLLSDDYAMLDFSSHYFLINSVLSYYLLLAFRSTTTKIISFIYFPRKDLLLLPLHRDLM